MGGIADQVIRRQHQQQRVIAIGRRLKCATVTAGAVLRPIGSSKIARFDPDLTHLLGHDEAVVFVADQQGDAKASSPVSRCWVCCSSVASPASLKGQYCVGVTRSRQRPQPCAGTSAKDAGISGVAAITS